MTERFGLGLAALARPAYITTGRETLGDDRSVDALREQTHAVLDAAFDAGVRYIDCARSYGRAEEFLAAWLRVRPDAAAEVTVASKWGYRYVGGWRLDADVHEVKDHSAAAFDEQWRLTRETLGDDIAIYQVHSLMPDDPLFADDAALDGLARLRDDDGVRVGFSTSGPAQADTVRRALAVRRGGAALFSVVQSTWSLLETSVGDALTEAAAAGLAVVVKEGMANGRLAPGGDGARLAADIAARHGVGEDAVALAAVLAQPFRPRVLSGAITAEQLHANLAASSVMLDPDDLAMLTSSPEPAERYWARRSEREWR